MGNYIPRRSANVPFHRSRAEALRLFEQNKGLAHAVLSRRFAGYPAQDREEFHTAAMLGLWEACQRYDPLRGFAFSTFATSYAVLTVKKHIAARSKRRRVPCVSLSDPLALGEGSGTIADTVAAPMRDCCPMYAILREQAISEAMDTWQSFPPSKRKQKPTIADDIRSVFGRSPEVTTGRAG